MPRERWTHPPLLGLEAPPAWRAVARFRLVSLVLIGVLVVLVLLAYRQFSGANDQDPQIVPRPGVTPGVQAPVLPGEG